MLSGVVRKAALTAIATGSTFLGFTSYKLYDLKQHASIASCAASTKPEQYLAVLPTRQEHLKSLQETPEYDVLVIGGGATGTGVALDAVTRGLKTALVEREDFAAQTSSKSTKLIHGGVRYLQAAILGFDVEQYKMVKEALRERSNFLAIAPHLTKALPILLPLYAWWQVPYMWIGIKMYDIVSGARVLRNSYYVNKERASDAFPQLKNDELKGGIVYFDGQQNDARMCVSLALTAARMGANVVNYVEVKQLVKENDKIRGAVVRDTLTGKEWKIRAKSVVNATGPFTDAIRLMDNPAAQPICQPSAGVHITLPGYFCPGKLGLLNAQTSDGRVIFFLPWQGVTIAGTTDDKCPVTTTPTPTDKEIDWILKECQKMIRLKMSRGDVLSAWSGIRPLVRNPHAKDTKSLARNHIIEVSPSNMITIAGGKWTTYRSMAEETVDKAVEVCKLNPLMKHSQTIGFHLEGAHGYDSTLFVRLINEYGVDRQVAKHLAQQYGDRSLEVIKLGAPTGKTWPLMGNRLVDRYPYIEAEVRYALKEYAVNATDVLARRMRLAFQDVDAAKEALPRVVEIMGQELAWDPAEKARQTAMATKYVDEQMGFRSVRSSAVKVAINDVASYLRKFNETAGPGSATAGPGSETAGPGGKGMPYTAVRKTLQGFQLGDVPEADIEALAKQLNSYHPNKEVNATEFLGIVAYLSKIKEQNDRKIDDMKKKT
ncbi:Glycerol-3-phosphate dehydrogenase, mitochondrial [Hypsibius exemplaris]|uniref:Glycerol-3-phosphate dehydrogenase n=1 Tax=Hypsibius exemplaris TaxID=2072580 RepID=A0A1W0WJ75_HYPEX|nr:Glycerol-3-phosphate dehydrogenase, mitochondrial [Hypsibius exemplaris]